MDQTNEIKSNALWLQLYISAEDTIDEDEEVWIARMFCVATSRNIALWLRFALLC